MKIIAGEAKGRVIKSRKGMETRPTLANVKESLFSMILPYINNCCFLDLFSGTGNIALEALSRGAKRAIMIEKDPEALKIIIENINNLGFENRCRAYKNDVLRAVKILGKKNEKFDIIFMDPPYKEELCRNVMKEIRKADILADGGLIICEHHMFEDLIEDIEGFKFRDRRLYGKKAISFFVKE
ncbi:MAG: 16S rRNA (guanine(966)-N(2))-methyltransferase RsmD [Fusobacterium sp. JB021]|nr:16S rRNA (guanine(966)-N(2))-methyltransferase RsmD [Fusobacterium sp. JB020]MDP0493291.1 16S rRNA (guanine(966)-N(2))-methyltransferase RsmD [Fusobacterium sp. JB021]MDP0506274.1 16S rRNA (guanine(966)-N(2))-methyltransferase RsmD [Fusobacterium sp. JB019]